MLDQYLVSDVIGWLEEKTLILNADFQRRKVWPRTAKTYFIDTILRGLPTHKIYVRTVTDVQTRRSVREVVDGQQRLRTIKEFNDGEFALGTKAGEFSRYKYEDLDVEQKQAFLSYRLSVEQLLNADNTLVLDMFHRLNAFGLSLNRQELRHGKFQGAFRWAVVESSSRWAVLWTEFGVVSVGSRVRMADDELMAQMLGVVLDGVIDGGQPAIDRLYKSYDGGFDRLAIEKLDDVIQYIVENLDSVLVGPFARAPQFMMLFAAVAHARFGIPQGDLTEDEMPVRDERALTDLVAARSNLGTLLEALEVSEDEVQSRFVPLRLASVGSTQRIRSRRIRFPMIYSALLPDEV